MYIYIYICMYILYIYYIIKPFDIWLHRRFHPQRQVDFQCSKPTWAAACDWTDLGWEILGLQLRCQKKMGGNQPEWHIKFNELVFLCMMSILFEGFCQYFHVFSTMTSDDQSNCGSAPFSEAPTANIMTIDEDALLGEEACLRVWRTPFWDLAHIDTGLKDYKQCVKLWVRYFTLFTNFTEERERERQSSCASLHVSISLYQHLNFHVYLIYLYVTYFSIPRIMR